MVKKIKEYKVTEEVEKEEGVEDYISGNWVRSGVKEHEEAVNIFAKRLVEDYDYNKNQIQTIPQFRAKESPSGKEKWPVDITVFKTERKTYDNVYMLVECKQPSRKDGRKQLDIYLNLVPSVEIGVWFNGKEHLYLWKVRDPETKLWTWREIPNIPKKGQRVEDIGLFKRKDLKPTHNLKAVFRDIRNHLAGMTTGITRDEALAQEMINILFCKIWDEKDKGLEETVDFRCGVNENKKEVKQRILKLFNEKVKDPKEYGDVFTEKDVITLDTDSLVYVVGELQNYCITEAERDVVGDAFEVFIGPALRGGEGQFFTPRNVVRMAVEMLNPRPGEYIIDPACGSGGFLIIALEHIWKKIKEEGKRKGKSKNWIKAEQKKAANEYFRGIDKDSFLAKVTKAYMAIIGDGRGGIFCENSLKPPEDWNPNTQEKIQLEKFDVLFTNPPFGIKIPIKGERILSQYHLAHQWKNNEETDRLLERKPPEILFIERCLQFLRDGGKLAIVLPEGLFGNIDDEYIRKFILREAKILAVIDCPIETFMPKPGTKTCILFLEKKKQKKNWPIFMAIAKKVGHNRRGQEIQEDDFPIIKNDYRDFVEKGATKFSIEHRTFIISSEDITDRRMFLPRRYYPLYVSLVEELKNKVKMKTIGEMEKENIIELVRGDEVGSVNYELEGMPFLRTNDIVNGVINQNPKHFVSEDIYNSYRIKQNLEPEDVLLTKDGKIGLVGMIKPGDRCVISSGILRVKIKNKNKLNPYYLFSILNSNIVQIQIAQRYVIAATLPHLHEGRIKEILVPLFKNQETLINDIKKSFKLIEEAERMLSKAKQKVEKLIEK